MSQAAIWNRFAKGYARRPVADPEAYETKLAMTAARLTPDMRLLEVGCGTGTTALKHAGRVAEIDAIDFSSEMIAIAKGKAREAGIENARFRVAALDDLPEGAGYDAVLAMSVIHLLADPGAGLKRLAGQVRPGGFLFSSTVCIGEMGGFLPRILPMLGWTRLLPKVAPLTKSNLIALHEAAGLEIVEEFQPGPEKAVFLIARKPDQTPA